MSLNRRNFLAGAAGLAAAGLRARAAVKPRSGCQTNAWNLDPARFDLLLTALKEIKELEFQGFETNIRFVQPQLNNLAKAKAQIEATGLVFLGAHTDIPAYWKLGNEKAAAQVTGLCADAKKFDAKAIIFSHIGSLSKTGDFTEQQLEQKCRFLDLAGQRCADAGIVLAYHNHEPEFEKNAREQFGLMRHTNSKTVMMMYDIGHAWRAYPDAISFFEQYHTRVYGLHVRDYHNHDISVPLGQGEFPLRKLEAAIQKTGWHGWLIDEEERPDMSDKPGMKVTGPSRKTMREIFGV